MPIRLRDPNLSHIKNVLTLKVGDQIPIYRDPISQLDLEGWATIVQILADDVSSYIARVQFNQEPESFTRLIFPPYCVLRPFPSKAQQPPP